MFELAENIIARYVHEEIDAAYIVYNEFKSVISQRLVVEQMLPLIKIGKPQIAGAVEPTVEERERAAEAALSAGIQLGAGGYARGGRGSEEIRHGARWTTSTSSRRRSFLRG